MFVDIVCTKCREYLTICYVGPDDMFLTCGVERLSKFIEKHADHIGCLRIVLDRDIPAGYAPFPR